MKTELICVGTELLTGKLNSNSSFIGDRLSLLGLDLSYVTTVGDNNDDIEEAFSKAIKRSQIIIATGGLGPTFDDLTGEIAAKVLDKKLILDKGILEAIKEFFKKRKTDMPKNNERQAYIIDGAKPIANKYGTAPGQIIELEDSKKGKGKISKVLFLLPGPPREMQPMFEEMVFPYLKKYESKIKKVTTLHISGMSESQVDEKIRPIIEAERELEKETVSFTILAHQMIIDLKISVCGEDEMLVDEIMHNLKKEFRDCLGDNIFGTDKDSLEGVIGKLLVERKNTLSVAESCTGGMVSQKITSIPGSSIYFKEGVVSYSNDAKTKVLGVKTETLSAFGSVSENTALEMAKGVKKLSQTDYALGITGIAGPAGGTEEKPVGIVFIALSSPTIEKVYNYRFIGNRNEIRERSANTALDILRRQLIEDKPPLKK
ncbi:MAG: competence/damage-inducible protein A [Elusimicrobia bacterium]|nr:competence/damage-inducible protein A [Elusimicrobiota bacterium]